MGSNIFSDIQQLEVLAFFSGYPLIYFLVRILTRNTLLKNSKRAELISILPFAYALTGTLYLGLQLKNIYPDYTIENIKHRVQQPWFQIWGLLSIIFWMPAIPKRQVLSLLHSLVFFLIIVKDLLFQFTGFIRDHDMIKNDMRLYTVSIFLNLVTYIFLFLFIWLFPIHKKYPGTD